MSTIIQVEKLSKSYRLGTIGGGTLRADVSRWLAKLRGKADPNLQIGQEHHARLMGQEFWALQDVSFELKQGEILGVIGRNGAGKSTLLKILSRVTAPTSGEVRVKGRIASLLEVGTGFHPELTGRENIFLNGAILGMNKAEIRAKFDEIVAFSEVEDFIDTPVKRYSSGMYVRLAFAVAAHLEPEILIVDEVLAVGDQEFQKKCMGKMKDVSQGGRTVLFVSHNMNAITSLCSSALVLKLGSVTYQGEVRQALTHYGASTQVTGKIEFVSHGKPVQMRTLEIFQEGKPTHGLLAPEGEVTFEFTFELPRRVNQPRIGAAFTNNKGDRVFAVATWLGPDRLPPMEPGHRTLRISFAMPPLVPGRYTLDTGFFENESGLYEDQYSAGTVEVTEANYLKTTEPTVSEIGQFYVRSKSVLS